MCINFCEADACVVSANIKIFNAKIQLQAQLKGSFVCDGNRNDFPNELIQNANSTNDDI